jgi:tight adherence protein C
MQAPVKLLLPLVVFIFPGTFAILLYPVIARVIVQGGLW